MTEQHLGTSINSPRSVKVEDGDYQVTLDDSIVAASTVSAPSTITLPDTRVLPGWVVCIKAQSLAGGSITIQGLNGQQIDGVATFVLLMANDSVILQSIGDSWVVCGWVQVGGVAVAPLEDVLAAGNKTGPVGAINLLIEGQPTVQRAGGSLSIGDGLFNGGRIVGVGGEGLSGNNGGGNIAWIGGNAFQSGLIGNGSGGSVLLLGGEGANAGGGGGIELRAGDPGNDGDGADVTINASDGTSEVGSTPGQIEITAGSTPGGGTNFPGSVTLERGFGGNQLSNINVNGPIKLWFRTVFNVGSFTAAETTFHLGSMIFVSDETGGAVPAWSDGTNWRRVSDGAIVS